MKEIEKMIDEKMNKRKAIFLEQRKLDKKFENAKLKRCLLTIVFYTVVNMMILYAISDVAGKGMDFKNMLAAILPSIFIAGISYWVNFTIFLHHFIKTDSENAIIASMEKRLSETDKEIEELRKIYTQNK